MIDQFIIDEIKASVKATYEIEKLCEQFIDYGYTVSQHSKWTMTTRATHMKQFSCFCKEVDVGDIRHLNMIIVDAYFKHYSKSHSKSTVNSSKRIIKVFIAWLEEYKEISLSVKAVSIHSVRIKDTTPKAIDTALIAKVIAEAQEQDSLLVATAYEAGLRITELVNIKVSDIDHSDIKVIGKGSIERLAHVTDELATDINDFIIDNERRGDDFLFQKREEWGGGGLSTGTARLRIQKAFMEIVGLKMYPHQLRHTFAITLLDAGCDIVTIQRLLGHQDITTTMTYLRVSDNYVKREYKEFMGKSLLRHKHIDI